MRGAMVGSLPCWLLQEATLLSFHTLLPLFFFFLPLHQWDFKFKYSQVQLGKLRTDWFSAGPSMANQQGWDSVFWYCGVSMLFQTFTVLNVRSSGYEVFFQPQQSRALGSENYIYCRPVRAHHPLCPAQSYRSSSRARVVKEHRVITPIKAFVEAFWLPWVKKRVKRKGGGQTENNMQTLIDTHLRPVVAHNLVFEDHTLFPSL